MATWNGPPLDAPAASPAALPVVNASGERQGVCVANYDDGPRLWRAETATAATITIENAGPEDFRGNVVDGAELAGGNVVLYEYARPVQGVALGAPVRWNVDGDSTVCAFGEYTSISYVAGDDHMVIMSNGEEVLRYPVAAGFDGAQAALIAEVKRLCCLLAQRPDPDARPRVCCDHGWDD